MKPIKCFQNISIALFCGSSFLLTACHAPIEEKTEYPSNKTLNIVSTEELAEPYDTLNSWLRLNTTQQTIIRKLGKPEKLGKTVLWSALGTYVQEWEYPSKGIFLHMESETRDGQKKVLMLSITNPCNYKTTKNIGINSSRQAVTKAYAKYIDKNMSNKEQIIAGSIYGGVIFEFKNDKVSNIFIGAMAE